MKTLKNFEEEARFITTIGNEAVYTRGLWLEPGTTLDLAGLTIYYENVSPPDPYTPGSGVTILDSVGGGSLTRVGSGTAPEIIGQPAPNPDPPA